jgi:hypothetical protein
VKDRRQLASSLLTTRTCWPERVLRDDTQRKPAADQVPHQPAASRPRTLGEVQAAFRALPPVDGPEWFADSRGDDEVFGPDDPPVGPWERGIGEPTG